MEMGELAVTIAFYFFLACVLIEGLLGRARRMFSFEIYQGHRNKQEALNILPALKERRLVVFLKS